MIVFVWCSDELWSILSIIPRFYYDGLSGGSVLLLVVIVFVFLKNLVEGMNVHILEF